MLLPQVVQARPRSQPPIIKIRRPLSFFPIDVSKPPLPASNSVKFAAVVGMRGRLDAKLQVYVGAAGRCPLAPWQAGSSMTRAPKLRSNMLQLLPTTMYETWKSRNLQVCVTVMLTMCFLKCFHVD